MKPVQFPDVFPPARALRAGRLPRSCSLILLLGLLAERVSVGAAVLANVNVDIDKVRTQVAGRLQKGDAGGVGRRPYSDETREVIDHAISEARKLGHKLVGTEHLLLGLVRHQESAAAQVLHGEGISVDKLREEVLATLRSEIDDKHDLSRLKHGVFEWVHQQELAKAFRSTAFWHTMILAVDSANRLGTGEIQPEHLLLALLRDSEGPVSKLLGPKGVTADWVREQVVGKK